MLRVLENLLEEDCSMKKLACNQLISVGQTFDGRAKHDRVALLHHGGLQMERNHNLVLLCLGELGLVESTQLCSIHKGRVNDFAGCTGEKG